MSRRFSITSMLLVTFGFTLSAVGADKKPELIDENLPLQKIRPLDRTSFILMLQGEWGEKILEQPSEPGGKPVEKPAFPRPAEDKVYHVNYFFQDGGCFSHRVVGGQIFPNGAEKYLDYRERLDRGRAVADKQFLKGEVRCLFHDHVLAKHKVTNGSKITIVVSVDEPATSSDSAKVITKPFDYTWQADRKTQDKPVRTKHSPPEITDGFPK